MSNQYNKITFTKIFKFISLYSSLLTVCVAGPTKHIIARFSDPGSQSDEEGPQFNSLVLDKNTGRVYIGAVNKLYQLSPNLEQMIGTVTGPSLDSPHCSVLPDCPPQVRSRSRSRSRNRGRDRIRSRRRSRSRRRIMS